MDKPDNRFPKREKLTGKIRIDTLYKEGRSFVAFPFFIVLRTDNADANNRVIISVPKRNFKHAVDRNLLKRRIREAYRLNKHLVEGTNLHIALNYIAKFKMEYAQLEQKMHSAILKINKEIQPDDDHHTMD